MHGSGYEAVKTAFRIGKYVKPKTVAVEVEANPKGKGKAGGKAKAGPEKTKKTLNVARGKAKQENPVHVDGSDEESDSEESEKGIVAIGESIALKKAVSESGGSMATRNPDLKSVQDFASTINSDDRVKAVRTRDDLPVELDMKAPLDWYIVKKHPRTGIKKMVEAYGGSPEWKPKFMFVKASKNYYVAWNYREAEGLRAVKDDWTKEDDERVAELDDDLKKILKYPKLIKWSDVQHYIPPIPVEEEKDTNVLVEEEKDEEESTTVVAGAKNKSKRLVKVSEKEKKKKADVAASKLTVQGENIVKGPLEEEATILPSHVFEGGPTVAVHTFGDPPTIECPLLEEFAAQLTATDIVRLVNECILDGILDAPKEIKGGAGLGSDQEGPGACREGRSRGEESADTSQRAGVSLCGMAVAIEEVNLAATEYRAHKLAVAGLKRLNGDRPIKAKWFKQFLKESPKKTMYEALVKVLTKLSGERLSLWEALCKTLVKMGTPEDMAMFPGDPATVLSKGPSEKEPIPEVPDEYISIELEEEDDEASREDVTDIGNSGVQKNAGETSQSHPEDGSTGQDAV
ncbi:OLC1v1000499C1 [Oldenlandia corymbosa var. corymbosa]|uniref:OLC1v1000499C1 n=1 Tax=Oldenlandia corymbosa var. corymbosa TaxID=529605 RepID=A0AAV1D3Y3_OLDCO|nr:OLC1v1000499C1 [Oldenlandia corymbosa var. corymbosa]